MRCEELVQDVFALNWFVKTLLHLCEGKLQDLVRLFYAGEEFRNQRVAQQKLVGQGDLTNLFVKLAVEMGYYK